MRALQRLVVAFLLLFPAVAQAQDPSPMVRAWELSRGEERILSFVAAVTIEPDGDLEVTETIRLVSLAQEINHGIQRDFPTSYSNGAGQRTRVAFTVLSVQRDGHDEPWEEMTQSNGVRVRIGSADISLPPAEHTFVIRYRTTRQIAYGAASDELYWNVTGTGWTFPIDMAEARITLPVAAALGNRAVYTGPQGSRDHHAEVIEERPGYIAFRTTDSLAREEGLTVAVAFPKGVLEAPDARRRASWWLEDWGALAAALLASLGLVGYYFRAWWKAGRNPRAGTIVPLFSPPDDLSPAAMRYISRMKFDNRAFSAALVYLGVRGHLHITQGKGGFLSKGDTTLRRTKKPLSAADSGLPSPERTMCETLFGPNDIIKLKQENHTTLQSARAKLEKGLADDFEGTMFRKNSDWAYYGVYLIVLAVLGIALIALLATSSIGLAEKIGLPALAALLLGGAWWLRQTAKDTKGCLTWIAWAAAIACGFAATAMVMGTVIAAIAVGAYAIFIPLLMLPVACSAFFWMYAPTPEGRRAMDRIAGFRQYLSITEERRLDAMHPPEKTPELFERYLPYAIALDVENRWAERFAGVLAAAAAAAGTTAQTIGWYSGQGNVWDNPNGFVSDLGSSFASTVSSASTSPSSSSDGSSGGGSSGGGGGGGGGSGW